MAHTFCHLRVISWLTLIKRGVLGKLKIYIISIDGLAEVKISQRWETANPAWDNGYRECRDDGPDKDFRIV